jgi:hypothetical protein
MSCRNKCVLRIHWTLESSRDYGRRMTWVCSDSQRLSCCVEAIMQGERSSAPRAGSNFDTPSLEGYTFVDFRLRSSTRSF